MVDIEKGAVLSECGMYRYLLTRRWDDGPALGFVMLNPSVADASIDDPTIRKCMGFATRYGFSGIEVVNLFAYRATKPKDMLAARDPVGPDNDEHIRMAVRATTNIVCAWGPNASRTPRPRHVIALLKEMGIAPKCLHITQDGSPGHPLMLSYDRPLAEFG